MTEVSNFQTIKTSFTVSGSVISSFAMRAQLVLGPGCIIVPSSSRIRFKVMLSGLVWWLWSVLCISAVKVSVLAVLSPVIAKWLKSNRLILLVWPTFSRIVSLPISLAWIISSVLSIARRHVYISGISCVASISASRVLPWVILASPIYGALSISLSATKIIAWSSVFFCAACYRCLF